jgi:hypothetical protein
VVYIDLGGFVGGCFQYSQRNFESYFDRIHSRLADSFLMYKFSLTRLANDFSSEVIKN